MTRNFLCRAVLIVILCATLVAPARSESLQTLGNQVVAGIVVVSVGIGVVVVLLILHHKNQKRAITGCVGSGATGNTLTDERDKRTYVLSGNPAGIKPGDRMKIEGQRKKSDRTLVFEVNRVIKDLGLCPI